MDKNLLWAVTISILIYALWFGLIEKRYVKHEPPAVPAAAEPARPARPAAAAPSPEATVQDRQALESEAATVSAHAAQLRIHPQGAAIISCRYRAPLGEVELVQDPKPGLFATWPELRFQSAATGPDALLFSAVRPDGMRIEKEFLPEGKDLLPRIRIRMSNPTGKTLASGGWTMSIGSGLDTVPGEKKENPKVWRALGLLTAEKGLKGKIEAFKPGEHAGAYRWVGIDNRYFLAAALPKGEEFGPVESAAPPLIRLQARSVDIAPHGERTWEIPYFLGAKSHIWLSRYKLGLERSIDFGFFAQLGRFVLRVLYWLHGLVGNWGWAIVILTVLIQTALFPLTYKSMKAMAAMKKLQPEIARLQQKYAKDPSRLNAETMELYKKSGANPLGGCLPMLLQMPVFIALFNALRNSWELHGASWMLWVRDLSAKDPYYVLPIVMGAVMFLQNRMNPAATSDQAQKTMMTWMPVIFTFIFISTPAGLVLYWLTSSIISAGIQLALKEHFEQA